MSIDIDWLFFKLNEADYTQLKPSFDASLVDAPTIPEYYSLNHDKSRGYDIFELSELMYHKPVNEFVNKICSEDSIFPAENNFINYVSQRRISPVTLLLLGLGRDDFLQLPGCLGNLLVRPDEVDDVLALTKAILDVNWNTFFDRATIGTFFFLNKNAVNDISQALNALPNALEIAGKDKSGLLSVTTWGYL